MHRQLWIVAERVDSAVTSDTDSGVCSGVTHTQLSLSEDIVLSNVSFPQDQLKP